MITVAASLLALIVNVNSLFKTTPDASITTPSNGVEGTSLQLTVNAGGSTGTVTWSVTSISGTAAISGGTLQLQQAGTVRLTVNIAADAEFEHYTGYRLITINPKDEMDPNQAQIWGIASDGGAGKAGSLFRLNADGSNFTIVHEFVGAFEGYGAPYNIPIIASDGNLYGTLSKGGAFDGGVIFQYNLSTHVYNVLHEFNGAKGITPTCELYEATNGKFYGTTRGGGANNLGVLFSFDKSNNTYEVLNHFDGANGASPISSPREMSNGKILGVTPLGGNDGDGVIYEYDITSSVYTVKYLFPRSENTGIHPYGSPRRASNGKFYLTTLNTLNTNNAGVVYEYDPVAGSATLVKELSRDHLASCYGSFTSETPDGKMYISGTQGGSFYEGGLIEYVPGSNSVTLAHGFQSGSGTKPIMSPTLASNGKLYGVTSTGSWSTEIGALYEYNTVSNKYKYLLDIPYGFKSAGLVEGPNGFLYGILERRDDAREASLFSYDIANNELEIIKTMRAEAMNPSGPIASDGDRIFISTSAGGVGDMGSMLSFDATTNVMTRISDYQIAGYHPVGFLYATQDKLFGSIIGNFGAISLTSGPKNSGVSTSIFGPILNKRLTEDDDDILYGVGRDGGNNLENIFSFDTETEKGTVLNVSWNATEIGQSLYGVTFGGNGMLYGVSKAGGINSAGIIYSFAVATSKFTKLHDFHSPEAFHPLGEITLAPNGKFYGIAESEGENSTVIYEFDPATNDFSIKKGFGEDTAGPGQLMRGNNGLLFGYGFEDSNPDAFLFTYDTELNMITKNTSVDIGSGIMSSTVVKKNTSILSFHINDRVFDGKPFKVEAVGSVDEPIVYSSKSGRVSIDGDQVTPLRPGRIDITARILATELYANSKAYTSFCLNPPTPTIIVTPLDTAFQLSSASEGGYIWYKDGTDISGEHKLIVEKIGTYRLVIGYDDCRSEMSDPVRFDITKPIPTALEDELDKLMKLYPNPASDKLFVDIPAGAPVIISLLDYLGRPIETRSASPLSKEQFEVGELPASMYIVRVSSEGKTVSKIFVKK